jgi:hypothetical protein
MPPLVLAIAVVATLGMGFAIQRGATCTVAAVGEIVNHRRSGRLVALAETALWVAAGMLVARALGLTMTLPQGFDVGWATVAGGVLLGLGAVVNGACVFGAIARLSSGDYAFAATPVGFFLGAWVAVVLGSPAMTASGPAPLFTAPVILTVIVAAMVVFRAARFAAARRAEPVRRSAWNPHVATLVIGLCFVVTLVTAGAWAYTDALADLARGMSAHTATRLLLFAALLGGAFLGGASAGLLGHRRPTVRALVWCLCGGMLMGAGSLLIPGSNDGLILLGLPLLLPHAWVAFAVMMATVAAALIAARRFSPPSGPAHR